MRKNKLKEAAHRKQYSGMHNRLPAPKHANSEFDTTTQYHLDPPNKIVLMPQLPQFEEESSLITLV
jgi:hypothetical protein